MASLSEGWDAADVIRISAAPERVWAIVSDVDRHPTLAGSGEVLAVRMDGPLAPGSTFTSDVRTGEVGSFTARCVIEAADAPTRLAWVSYPPLDDDETEDHQIEVHWSFDLSRVGVGTTDLQHTLRVPPPKAGAAELAMFLERTDRIAKVRKGMEQTLRNVKAAAEQG